MTFATIAALLHLTRSLVPIVIVLVLVLVLVVMAT